MTQCLEQNEYIIDENSRFRGLLGTCVTGVRCPETSRPPILDLQSRFNDTDQDVVFLLTKFAASPATNKSNRWIMDIGLDQLHCLTSPVRKSRRCISIQSDIEISPSVLLRENGRFHQ